MRRAVCLALLVLMAPPLRPRAQQAPARSPLDLVGTWTLESSEPGTGGPRTLGANLKGLLIFDAAGHIFELVTRATMAQPAGADPPLADQQLRFAMSGGFWGTYRADAQQKTISYQPQGAVNPNMMGRDLTRSFELEGDRLVITYRDGEHYAPAGTRWTFDRVPAVENLSPTYRRVAGFWQHVVEKRLNLTTGVTLSETRRAPSIIVYSPSGYVGVHFPPLNRVKFAADAPTEAEARAAFAGYVGYFGALSVYPDMVFHQILSGISHSGGTTLKRPLEMSGNDEVTIKFPPVTNPQGQQTQTLVTLRRLSGEADMLPPRPAGR